MRYECIRPDMHMKIELSLDKQRQHSILNIHFNMLYTTHDEMFNATQQTQSYAHFQFVSVSIAAHMLTEY